MRCLLKAAGSPLVVILLFVASTDQRAAVGHEISIFAQPGDVFHGRTITEISHEETLFSINNLGEIAFMAEVEAGVPGFEGDAFVVMTQNRLVAGAGQVVDGVVPAFDEEDNGVWINDLGQVAYSGRVTGKMAVFLDDKMLFRSGDLIAGRESRYFGDYPVVDGFGTVAFRVTLSDPGAGAIMTQHGIVAESGDVIDGFTINTPRWPRINGDGITTFFASTTDSGSDDSVFTTNQRLIGPGDVISGIPVAGIEDMGNINSEGIVTATFVTGTWPDQQRYVATQDELLLGPGSIVAGLELTSVGEAHMTSDGLIVFLGDAVSNDGSVFRHLFAGDEILLTVGDEFEGHTIDKIWGNFHINEGGDVVVQVRLDNIGNVIVLAAVPEPSTISMLFFGTLLMLLRGRRQRARRRRWTHRVASDASLVHRDATYLSAPAP